MKLETRRVPSGAREAVIATLIGEWDSFNLRMVILGLEEAVAAARPTCSGLILEVNQLTFVNSASLGYLIRVGKGEDERILKGLPGRVILVNPAFLAKTLHALGLDRIFKIGPTVDAALTELARMDSAEAPTTPAP